MFGKFLRDENAATAIEYSLIAGFIALAIIAAVGMTGQRLVALFESDFGADALERRDQSAARTTIARPSIQSARPVVRLNLARSIAGRGSPASLQARTATPRPAKPISTLVSQPAKARSIRISIRPTPAQPTMMPRLPIPRRPILSSGRIVWTSAPLPCCAPC